MTESLPVVSISELAGHAGARVAVRGWIANKRSSGKIAFLQVRADKRAPGGVEISLDDFALDYLTADFPIAPKDHGTAFLMENRHLWLRSTRQRAALRGRTEAEQA